MTTTSGKQAQDRSNLITSAITALIGGPVILILTYIGGIPFLITGLVMAVLSVLEFCALGNDRHMPGNIILALPGSVIACSESPAGASQPCSHAR